MLINNWNVASEASEVVMGSPRKVRMLGFDFVLFRDGTGRVACLSDVCIHRGASLSKGRCEGDRVACAFHGWESDGEAGAQQSPALGVTQVPTRGRLDQKRVVMGTRVSTTIE